MLSLADQNNLMHKYQDLYFKKYKIKLSDQEALAQATLLVKFWRIIRQPITIPKSEQIKSFEPIFHTNEKNENLMKIG